MKQKRNCAKPSVGEQQYVYLICWVVGCRRQSTYEQPGEKISGRQGVASEANQGRGVTTGRVKRTGREDKNSLILQRHRTSPKGDVDRRGFEDGKKKNRRERRLRVSGLVAQDVAWRLLDPVDFPILSADLLSVRVALVRRPARPLLRAGPHSGCFDTVFPSAARSSIVMTHTRGLVSIAQALCRTFIAPLNTSRAGLVQPRILHPIRYGPQVRYIQHSRRVALADTDRAPINEAINAPYVQLVNAENSLEPPVRLSKVLSSFDHREYFLVQVSPGAPDRPPVCKILNKKETRDREKAKAKAAKASRVQVKQIELNWAIDPHDLAHRLKQLANFLEKGRRVEVVLTRKKGKRAATVEEIKHVMQSVLDTTRELGATQVKPMEGEPGKQVIITVKKET